MFVTIRDVDKQRAKRGGTFGGIDKELCGHKLSNHAAFLGRCERRRLHPFVLIIQLFNVGRLTKFWSVLGIFGHGLVSFLVSIFGCQIDAEH